MDKVLIGFIAIILTLIVLGAYTDLILYKKAEKFEQDLSCEYIGRARDLRSVAFFDCKGEIVMRRVK
jgi:hypothetical protein